jgi:hypothetical protein
VRFEILNLGFWIFKIAATAPTTKMDVLSHSNDSDAFDLAARKFDVPIAQSTFYKAQVCLSMWIGICVTVGRGWSGMGRRHYQHPSWTYCGNGRLVYTIRHKFIYMYICISYIFMYYICIHTQIYIHTNMSLLRVNITLMLCLCLSQVRVSVGVFRLAPQLPLPTILLPLPRRGWVR